VSVWKDTRLLGKAAGEAALQLCKDPDPTKLSGTAPFQSPGGNAITAMLLQPDPITKDNLQDVLDAGWIDKPTLCQGVASGTVAVCG
jgi:D-xylose transport system substrate-binding protein